MDDRKLHTSEEVYKDHVIGEFAEMFHRLRVPGGWIYTHTYQRFGGWGRKSPILVDTFVPDPPTSARPK